MTDEPASARALLSQGVALAGQGRDREAAQILAEASAGDPAGADAPYNLGVVRARLGDAAGAIAAWRAALERKPDHPAAAANLGLAYMKRGDNAAAADLLVAAAAIHPGDATLRLRAGQALAALRRLEEAREYLARALEIAPGDAGGWYALGLCCRDLGRRREAEAAFAQAVARRPDWAEAHFELAQTLLLGGDYERGFAEYAWRWKRAATPARTFSRPPWQGGELKGKTLLLYAEQGAGDAIQFVRYVPLAAGLGVRVAVACHRSLMRLFATVEGVWDAVPLFAEGGAFDAHAPLMGLPAIYGTTLATVPSRTPYISVPDDAPAPDLGPDDGALKVGIVWAGNPAHANDRARSCPADALAPLAAVPGVRLFGLQVGAGAAETLARVFPGARDLGPGFRDFADTAAAVAALDLTIAVDTAVAHLAGALARPVWTLLPFAPDWRWLEERDDSPWYPTMRLFRQARAGDWDELGRRVAASLRETAAGRADASNPSPLAGEGD